MNRLLEFLQEDNGGFSSTRLAFLLWATGVLVVWAVTSLESQPMTLARIDPSVATILGILMTGKVVQKFGEKPDGPSVAGGPAQLPTSNTPQQVPGGGAPAMPTANQP